MAAESRKDQAVQMRLAGMSRSQIADALGLGSGGQPLGRWLQGVPAPAWTCRPRAKDDLREAAVAMRKEGRSYREIQAEVGVAKSTLSLWLATSRSPRNNNGRWIYGRRKPPPGEPRPSVPAPRSAGRAFKPRPEPRSPI